MTAFPLTRNTPRSAHEEGFTLVELLTSLALLVLVVGLLSGGLRFARGTWEAAARLDHASGYDSAESFLRARLSEALPVYEPGLAGTVRVAFEGAGNSVTFVAPAPNGPVGAGLYRYTLSVAAFAAKRALVVTVTPYANRQTAQDNEPPRVEHILVDNIRSFSIRYFGRISPRAQSAWADTWTRADAIPDLVELTIQHAAGTLQMITEQQLRPRRL